MVFTATATRKEHSKEESSSSSNRKRSVDHDATSSPNKTQKTNPPTIVSPEKTSPKGIKAKNLANQGLIDKLSELATAMLAAASHGGNEKNKFKGEAIMRAVSALAQVEFEIQRGSVVSQGPKKVKGVGSGTAYYIDEFLQTGNIKEIQKFSKIGEDKDKDADKGEESKNKTESTNSESSGARKGDKLVIINRAPVLTLWATMVAEREGFSRDESLTYAKWISTQFAKSKGKALGIIEKNDTKEATKSKKQNDDGNGEEPDHVIAFGRMKIPVRKDSQRGNRLAILDGQLVEPYKVDYYLRQKFGGKLIETEDAMKELIDSMEVDELKEQAYDLYTRIRPVWRGWGTDSALNLSMIKRIAEDFQK
jgi:hypothetical protein